MEKNTRSEIAAEKEAKANKTEEWLFNNEWLRAKKVTVHTEDYDYERIMIDHPGAVAVIPIDEEGNLILVQQYRSAIQELTLELPAGRIDGGLCLADEAQRELQEEIGYKAGQLTPFGFLYSAPGFTNEKVFLFIGKDLTPSQLEPDLSEVIDVVKIPFTKAVQMIDEGIITDSKTIIGILRYLKKD
jgi:ADP-ribose pyrophosphatase